MRRDNSRAFEWLAGAQEEPRHAHREWTEKGYALLPLGTRFNAIVLPGRLVRAAATITDPIVVDGMLTELLHGPVIHNTAKHVYYALVEPEDRWEHRSVAAMLGKGAYLTVPAADMRGPMGLHWSVPPREPGVLCDIEGAAKLLEIIRSKTGQLR